MPVLLSGGQKHIPKLYYKDSEKLFQFNLIDMMKSDDIIFEGILPQESV